MDEAAKKAIETQSSSDLRQQIQRTWRPWEREGIFLAWNIFRYGQLSRSACPLAEDVLSAKFDEERAMLLYRNNALFRNAVDQAIHFLRRPARHNVT